VEKDFARASRPVSTSLTPLKSIADSEIASGWGGLAAYSKNVNMATQRFLRKEREQKQGMLKQELTSAIAPC
jgi:hypothetical protein